MSAAHGPLIQRQGFIRRAPSGKLSAFKKWEKKWCVFALSKRSGPVIDFFENREGVGSGPAAAIGRVELKNTKQVCAAIQCKVPYTFIVVTENRIVSLAAMSQSDADAWISCLRRVLGKEGCLQSSEEHEYEISGNAMTRQEQQRLSRARRRPPTPPDSGSDDGAPPAGAENGDAPPVPPSLPKSERISPSVGASPALPPQVAPPLSKRAMGKTPKPPPVPTSERPRLVENDFTPKREPPRPRDDPQSNMQAVLQNYEESPDTTYEPGDRRVISTAAHTLNSKMLTASLLREQQWAQASGPASSKSSTLKNEWSASAAPVYSKINKQAKGLDKNNEKRPVPARRNLTLSRIEHDFSPSLAAAQVGDDSRSTSSDSSSEDSDAEFINAPAAPPRPSNYDDDDVDEAEDTYTCMDAFADSPIERLNRVSQLNPAQSSDSSDDERYAANPTTSGAQPTQSTPPETPPLPVHEKPQPSTPPQSVIGDNIYENSKTVIDKSKGTARAMPTAVPRRGNTIGALPVTKAEPPKPSKRASANAVFSGPASNPQTSTGPNDLPEEDNYENLLGAFGTGVASERSSATSTSSSIPPSVAPPLPKKTSKISAGQSNAAASASQVPLPVIPGTNSSKRVSPIQSPPSSARHRIVAVPLADGESTDSSGATPRPPPDEPSLATREDDLRNRIQATSSNTDTLLPSDEAPPPYTPPRLLNDTQLNNNMDCIAEGNSDEEAEPIPSNQEPRNNNNKQNQVTVDRPEHEQEEQLYDSHPAFNRRITPGPTRETDIDGDITNKTNNTQSTKASSALTTASRISPHTPPGTPPAFARRKSAHAAPGRITPADGKYSPTEDIVIRLEDSFPKMQQRPTSRPHSNYLEDVVVVSPPHSSIERKRNPNKLQKSFSVMSSNQKNSDNSPGLRPLVTPRRAASTDALEPFVAEYDHVIRERVLKANKRPTHSDSSTDDSDHFIVRRKPTKQTEARQRRKSAPPTSLAIRAMSELASAKAEEEVLPVRPSKQRRYSRTPLPGGTLLREGKVFKAPQRDRNPQNLPLKQAQTELLQEEIAHSYGVNITVWRKDVKYALFVDIMNFVWVAGWNQKERPLLQNIFHIGDKIISVNNEPFTSTTKLMKLIKRSDSETKFEIVLRRLPFGKAYFIHKHLDYEDVGLELKEGTAELVKIVRGGLAAQKGLRVNPNKAFGKGQCHWIITEVNHRPLNFASSDSEAQARLTAVGRDITFVVQPEDFVEMLRKALKSTFGWKDYLVS